MCILIGELPIEWKFISPVISSYTRICILAPARENIEFVCHNTYVLYMYSHAYSREGCTLYEK